MNRNRDLGKCEGGEWMLHLQERRVCSSHSRFVCARQECMPNLSKTPLSAATLPSSFGSSSSDCACGSDISHRDQSTVRLAATRLLTPIQHYFHISMQHSPLRCHTRPSRVSPAPGFRKRETRSFSVVCIDCSANICTNETCVDPIDKAGCILVLCLPMHELQKFFNF